MEAQRVMVIQDGSKEVCASAIRWPIHGLFLKPGDLLVLLGVLHEVDYSATSSFNATRKILGYRNKVDSSSKFGSNHRILGREAARKDEYENTAEIMEISKLLKAEKVEFRIEVAAGASPAFVAVKSAENLKATWVILDRKIKKDKKIFLEKLSCGISRMKRNNSIELLRGPKMKLNELSVTYDDMMPGAGTPEEDDLFSIELFPTCQGQSDVNHSAEEGTFASPTCTICHDRKQNAVPRKDFTYSELEAATDGFSLKNNVSKVGGAESTFRGQLENKVNVVIKSAKNNHNTYFEEVSRFKSEVDELCRVRHKNLVMLLGCCAQGSHRLLVYEYICNGSLDQHLSKFQPVPLTWTERLRIAMGASRGLSYLHENNRIHRNIRPTNILLNHDFEPLIGDLGLATVQSDRYLKQENIHTSGSGCLAPEYLETGRVSTQTDVYSFGVLLLELITGQRTLDKNLGLQAYFTWARRLLKQRRYLELLDPRIADSHDVNQLYRLAQLAQKCLTKNPKERVTMNKVVSTLESIMESKPSNLHVDNRLLKSYLPHNCIKTVQDEDGEDVTSHKRSRSFSANLRTWPSFGTSSREGKGYKFVRSISATTNQVFYGEML
ncbi:hypothetical protein CCACVL1_28680 [Corchorus capsularis]|uniref:Protein kinase domain-containing protein n=1 Tax=Corchorus capsularis TaxID=210143 RepID=A0A1R3G5L9_COCAP|nr:hypothetical protein CCACVL1_28680 [Corchorus capsularis]